MRILIRAMIIDDYENMLSLWQISKGVGLSHADSEENIAAFLQRNPHLSFVAYGGEQLVGTMLCGHDGRRGYLHHLAVHPSYQDHGIGKDLVTHSLAALRQENIEKCHIFVFKENQDALTFWERIGWTTRVELQMMSQMTSPT